MQTKIYIAGAHSRASTFYEYVRKLHNETSVLGFVVDDLSDNKKTIDGIPVLKIEEGLDTEAAVYLAVRGVNHPHFTEELRLIGFKEIIPVDPDLDTELRNAYVEKVYAEQGRMLGHLPNEAKNTNLSATIYVASSAYDSVLFESYTPLKEEKVIQVGTALTDVRLAKAYAFDNQGDNISEKNKQFCELTALYWIWKNAKEDVVGLVHYRRHFLLPENWLCRMAAGKNDAILTMPLYAGPSVGESYRERHIGADLEFALRYIKEKCPEEYEAVTKYFNTTLYSPCNMFVMKKEVLNDYCTWVFPILFAVAENGGIREDKYQNRYPGFLSERLMSYFFESRKDKYNVVYENKNFLS